MKVEQCGRSPGLTVAVGRLLDRSQPHTGLFMLRYIIKVEPLASASVEEFVAAVAPNRAALPDRRAQPEPGGYPRSPPYSFLQRQLDLSLW